MGKVNRDAEAIDILNEIKDTQAELFENFRTLAADVNLMKQSMTNVIPAKGKKAAPKKPKMPAEEQIAYDYWKTKNADKIEKETGKKSVQLATEIKKRWVAFFEENADYVDKVPKKFRAEHPISKKKTTTTAKAKVVKNDDSSSDESDKPAKKGSGKKAAPKKKTPAKKAKTEPVGSDTEPSAKDDSDSSSDSSDSSDSD